MEKVKEFIIKNKIAVIIAATVVAVGIIIAVVVACLGGKGGKGDDEIALKDAKEASITVGSEGGLLFRDIKVYMILSTSLYTFPSRNL